MNGDLPGKQKRFNGSFLLLVLLLGGTLAVMCREGFRPYEVFWANDLPLGALMAGSSKLPGALFACWNDYFWIGSPGVVSLNLSNLCMALFQPEHHLKFYPPGSMFFLGFGAWFFFRQLRFAPAVCVLGGLAAGLNMHFFSNACWGLGQWNVCAGMIFFALGILVSPDIRPLWLKAVLAGFCTGMAIMEGFDVGAILSLYVGFFLAFLFLTKEEPPARRTGQTLLVGGLVVLAALLISSSTIFTLQFTQIEGTSADDALQSESHQASLLARGKKALHDCVARWKDHGGRWQFTTQWSIPRVETLRVLIPGLFGYRMIEFTTSTNKASSYWGSIAEDPHIQGLESSDPQVRTNAAAQLGIPRQIQDIFAGNDMVARQGYLENIKGQVQRRHTGNGEYAGVLVCLLAAFGLAGAWRKAGSPYSAEERRSVWFWAGAALVSLLAAWGRYGFVYRLVYIMPFLNNIRSPMKFMHPLNICLIILAGYGMETLYRRYLAQPSQRSGSLWQRWKEFSGFELKWVIGSGLVLLAAAAGYFIVQSSQPDIIHYLQHNGFDEARYSGLAGQIAGFCAGEVGWFVIYLALSAGVLIFILSGVLAGKRALWAWVLLGAIMICDLYRADVPWVRYYNYKEKISPNPLVDVLRQKPWEHRVTASLSALGQQYLGQEQNFGALCHWWLENDYPFNDIESLEIDQAPRMPLLDSSYLGRFSGNANTDLMPATRLWQLTNTRYIFGDAGLEPLLNQIGEPKDSFRTLMRMDMVPKIDYNHVEDGGDMTLQTNSQGALALIEFTHALPRAKLFANWQVMEDPAALQTLMSRSFDPEKTVLVAKDTPVAPSPGSPQADPGTVEISQYESKHLLLQADAKTPAVLLLNDHTGEYWNVWIDQKPGTILRCNYIMQGVFLPPGRHTIEFRYQPPQKLLYTSLATFALGILLGGYVLVAHFVGRPQTLSPAAGRPSKPNPKAV